MANGMNENNNQNDPTVTQEVNNNQTQPPVTETVVNNDQTQPPVTETVVNNDQTQPPVTETVVNNNQTQPQATETEEKEKQTPPPVTTEEKDKKTPPPVTTEEKEKTTPPPITGTQNPPVAPEKKTEPDLGFDLERLKKDPTLWTRLSTPNGEINQLRRAFEGELNPFLTEDPEAIAKLNRLASEGKLYVREYGRAMHYRKIEKNGEKMSQGPLMKQEFAGSTDFFLGWLYNASSAYFSSLGINWLARWFDRRNEARIALGKQIDDYRKEYKALTKQEKEDVKESRKREKKIEDYLKRLNKLKKQTEEVQQALDDLRGNQKKQEIGEQKPPETTQPQADQTPTNTQQENQPNPTLQQQLSQQPTTTQPQVEQPPATTQPQNTNDPNELNQINQNQLQTDTTDKPKETENVNTTNIKDGEFYMNVGGVVYTKENLHTAPPDVQNTIKALQELITKMEEIENEEKKLNDDLIDPNENSLDQIINEEKLNRDNNFSIDNEDGPLIDADDMEETTQKEGTLIDLNDFEQGPKQQETKLNDDLGSAIDPNENSLDQIINEEKLNRDDNHFSIDNDDGPLIDPDDMEETTQKEGTLIDLNDFEQGPKQQETGFPNIEETFPVNQPSIPTNNTNQYPAIGDENLERMKADFLVDVPQQNAEQYPEIDPSLLMNQPDIFANPTPIQVNMDNPFLNVNQPQTAPLAIGDERLQQMGGVIPDAQMDAPVTRPPDLEKGKADAHKRGKEQEKLPLRERMDLEKRNMDVIKKWDDSVANTLLSNEITSASMQRFKDLKSQPELAEAFLGGVICGLFGSSKNSNAATNERIMEAMQKGEPVNATDANTVRQAAMEFSLAKTQGSNGNKNKAPMCEMVEKTIRQLSEMAKNQTSLSPECAMIGKMMSSVMSVAKENRLPVNLSEKEWAEAYGAVNMARLAIKHHDARQYLANSPMDITSEKGINAVRDLMSGLAINSSLWYDHHGDTKTNNTQILMGSKGWSLDKLGQVVNNSDVRKSITANEISHILANPNGATAAKKGGKAIDHVFKTALQEETQAQKEAALDMSMQQLTQPQVNNGGMH